MKALLIIGLVLFTAVSSWAQPAPTLTPEQQLLLDTADALVDVQKRVKALEKEQNEFKTWRTATSGRLDRQSMELGKAAALAADAKAKAVAAVDNAGTARSDAATALAAIQTLRAQRGTMPQVAAGPPMVTFQPDPSAAPPVLPPTPAQQRDARAAALIEGIAGQLQELARMYK